MTNNPNAPLGFLYSRFSDKKQQKGSSLRSQTEAAIGWCKENGVALDSHSYRDLGVSGYTGEHRHNPDRHGLALFLNALRPEDRKIPKGSYLLLYNLDRLSREDIRPAYNLFNQILEAGVHIVQLRPERVFRHDATGSEAMLDILTAVVELSRANSESRMKSKRLSDNWSQTRTDAASGKKLTLPGKRPFWLDKTEAGYVVNEKTEAVREMFRLVREGMGAIRVAWTVNKRFGLDLSRPGVRQIIKGEQALGYWQPGDKSGKPVGERVKLYPAIVSQEEWDAAQGAMAGRINGDGKSKVRDRNRVYLFNSLLRDTKGNGFATSKTSGGNGALKFIPKSYLDGKTACVSFPVIPFEEAVVEALAEVDPAEVLDDGTDGTAHELLAMKGRREALAGRIAQAAEQLEDGDIAALSAKMRAWQREANQLDTDMAHLRQRIASPKAEAWSDAKKLAALMHDDETRMRFRSLTAQLVDRMVCTFGGNTRWRYAYVRIHFRDSPKFRAVTIHYRSSSGSFGSGGKPGKRKEPVLFWDTWKEAAPDPTYEQIISYLKDIAANYKE